MSEDAATYQVGVITTDTHDDAAAAAVDMLPCPFCQSTSVYMTNLAQHAWLYCDGCGCCGPLASTAAAARERWNGRSMTDK